MEHKDEQMQWKVDLEKALEKQQFRLYYQPKIDLVSGKIIGVETLIRWEHPTKGLILPIEFIPFAEATGLIIPIGEWVIRNACLQNMAWQVQGLSFMSLSINLSVLQLYQPDFISQIRNIINETKIPPENLVFEITESIMMDTERALATVKELKQMGIQISLDDYGTGFSSLHYLPQFPIDKIKIDQSFIRDCTTDLSAATIVKSTIDMGHKLKMDVIAEGIESRDQLIFLQQSLCNIGQGYLFSEPLPPEEFRRQYYKIEQIINKKGIPQEVSFQKLKEEALENTRQELFDIFRQQQGVIFKLIKEEEKIIYRLCDGELLYRMGLTPEQIIGKEISDFFPSDEAEKTTSYHQRAWQGEENVTYKGKFKGISYLASLRPIRRGGVVEEVIGSCIELTNQDQTDVKLRMNEINYHHIMENIQDVIMTIDQNGAVLYVSPSCEKVFGISAKEYSNQHSSVFIHPKDVHFLQSRFDSMVHSKASCQIEFRHKHAQREWVPIEANVTPILNENNEVEHFIVVGRNISSRIQKELIIEKVETFL